MDRIRAGLEVRRAKLMADTPVDGYMVYKLEFVDEACQFLIEDDHERAGEAMACGMAGKVRRPFLEWAVSEIGEQHELLREHGKKRMTPTEVRNARLWLDELERLVRDVARL